MIEQLDFALPPDGQTASLHETARTRAGASARHPAPTSRETPSATPEGMAGYGMAAPIYLDAGWRGVLPVPEGEKRLDTRGWTGRKHRGRYPAEQVVRRWAKSKPKHNVALRLDESLIGVDVDAYDDKSGGKTLTDLELELGPLPATWRSTSRPDDLVSGIRWFRVPEGIEWHDFGPDIDAIWWGHRYALVWPSIHPEGRSYVWVNPAGDGAERVPSPEEFPDLPSAWVEHGRKPEPVAKPTNVAAKTGPAIPSPAHEVTARGQRWAEVGLVDEEHRVATATRGRNDQLNASAYKQGRRVGGGLLTQEQVEQALWRASETNGHVDKRGVEQTRATIKSGLERGMQSPVYGPDEDRPHLDDAGSWQPLDLGAWFDSPPPPAERFGSGSMLYRGSLSWLAGEPESGKSILMLLWAIEEMRLGNNVVLLDEEAGPRDVFAKLQALGATPEELSRHLTYLPPAARDILRDAKELRRLVESVGATYVGVDGAAAHLAIANLNEDSAGDVTKLMVRGLMPLAHDVGAAVVVLDHMTKSLTNNRYARGSGAKLAKADAAFHVEAVQPFSKINSGRLRITSTKDRLGEFGRGAVWDVDVTSGDGMLDLRFGHLSSDEAAALVQRASRGPNPGRDARIRASLVSFLRAEPGASMRAVRDAGIAGKDVLDRVIGQMVEDLEVRIEGADRGGAPKRHYLIEQASLPGVAEVVES